MQVIFVYFLNPSRSIILVIVGFKPSFCPEMSAEVIKRVKVAF